VVEGDPRTETRAAAAHVVGVLWVSGKQGLTSRELRGGDRPVQGAIGNRLRVPARAPRSVARQLPCWTSALACPVSVRHLLDGVRATRITALAVEPATARPAEEWRVRPSAHARPRRTNPIAKHDLPLRQADQERFLRYAAAAMASLYSCLILLPAVFCQSFNNWSYVLIGSRATMMLLSPSVQACSACLPAADAEAGE
jgi:hypothetical protein